MLKHSTTMFRFPFISRLQLAAEYGLKSMNLDCGTLKGVNDVCGLHVSTQSLYFDSCPFRTLYLIPNEHQKRVTTIPELSHTFLPSGRAMEMGG